MKKLYLITALFFGVNNSMVAQNGRSLNLDSLNKVVPSMPDDSNKVKRYIDMCQFCWAVNPPEGVTYGKKALELAEKINWNKGMATANGVLGMNHIIISDYPKAKEFLQKALALSEELNDLNGVSKANGALGNVYYFQSQYPQAIDQYIKAAKAAEKIKDTAAVVAGLSNIGSIHLDLEKYPEALDYFQKALALNEARHGKGYMAEILGNIGMIYQKQNQLDMALEYLQRGLDFAEEMHDLPNATSTFGNMSTIYFDKGDIEKSLAYVKKQFEMGTKISDLNSVAFSYLQKCQIYLSLVQANRVELLAKFFNGDEKKCLNEANRNADSSIAIYKELQNIEKLRTIYKLKSEILDLLGDEKGAFENFKNYAVAKDSVFNMEKDKKLTQSAMQYEFDKKEAVAKADQEKKDIRQRVIRNSIAGGLAGALIFLIVVYRQRNRISKEKKRSEELLLNILPEEVAEELKQKGNAEAKQIDNVSVLFTDFKGFTQLSEKLSPKELVAEIDLCFRAFDNIVHKHGIEKIKTIGDSYMCAGGLPVPNNTHAFDVVSAAIDIQQFMHQHKVEREAAGKIFFEIRIGIHTGPVVAGIVGVKKYSYDIWGDTVNIASRMESSGETGKVNISGTTYELVKDKFTCTHRGKISAKNKGEIDMYFVEMSN